MAMAVAFGGLARSSWAMRSLIIQRKKCVFSPLACLEQTSSYSSASRKQLILYSKPGCCLCDALKENLQAALSLPAPVSLLGDVTPHEFSLHDVDLEIRDITTNPEWERAYLYDIPVLTRVRADGTEERLPRLSPRSGAEHIQMKVAKALNQ